MTTYQLRVTVGRYTAKPVTVLIEAVPNLDETRSEVPQSPPTTPFGVTIAAVRVELVPAAWATAAFAETVTGTEVCLPAESVLISKPCAFATLAS